MNQSVKSCCGWLLSGALALWAFESVAQLEVLRSGEVPCRFGGRDGLVEIVISNRSDNTVSAPARTRLLQASSATVATVAEAPWKRLELFPHQTVVESATISLPVVKAETRFVIQWLDGTSNIFGRTDVLVYPADLLKEFKPLAGDEALGIFDPTTKLKTVLKSAAVGFEDLEDANLDRFRGRLAIIGPLDAKIQTRDGLAKQIEAMAVKGVGVVWLQPPPARRDRLQPSFYSVIGRSNAVVVAQAGMVLNLADNPQSQINLLHFARLALHPETPRLPNLTPQP